jgi:hypothetical protein
MNVEQIVKMLEAAGVDAAELDELVHEAKAVEAAAINNCGLSEQVTYLVSCYGADLLAQRLDDAPFSWREPAEEPTP